MLCLCHKSLRIRYSPKHSLMRRKRVPPCHFSISFNLRPQLAPASPWLLLRKYSLSVSDTSQVHPSRKLPRKRSSFISNQVFLPSFKMIQVLQLGPHTHPACMWDSWSENNPNFRVHKPAWHSHHSVCAINAQRPNHTYQVRISNNAEAARSSPVQSWRASSGFFTLFFFFPLGTLFTHLLLLSPGIQVSRYSLSVLSFRLTFLHACS